jgi:hypothetical protein
VQFEPSSFKFAVEGGGDEKIDLFDLEAGNLSVAHYLVTRGWDDQPQHQRAIDGFYGGHYDADTSNYYMKAVLKYANEIDDYLKVHPVETPPTSLPDISTDVSNGRNARKAQMSSCSVIEKQSRTADRFM